MPLPFDDMQPAVNSAPETIRCEPNTKTESPGESLIGRLAPGFGMARQFQSIVATGHGLIRYYSVGTVNAAVGFGLYVIIESIVRNIYIAQFSSHFLGSIFNYWMFKKYLFQGLDGRKWRYVGAYSINYVLGIGALFVSSQIVKSPYLAGLLALFFVSSIHYFLLKKYVFRKFLL